MNLLLQFNGLSTFPIPLKPPSSSSTKIIIIIPKPVRISGGGGATAATCSYGISASRRRIPGRDRVIELGKYKGRMLGSLPSSYLKWVSKNLRAGDTEEWARLADEVLSDPVYRDRVEWEFAEKVLSGNHQVSIPSSSNKGIFNNAVSELLEISERFEWDNDDKAGWNEIDFGLLGTSKGGRIPRVMANETNNLELIGRMKKKEEIKEEQEKMTLEEDDDGGSSSRRRRRERRERVKQRKDQNINSIGGREERIAEEEEEEKVASYNGNNKRDERAEGQSSAHDNKVMKKNGRPNFPGREALLNNLLL